MEKHEKIYSSYKRNHKYENSLESEESKISHEHNKVTKLNKEIKKKTNNLSYDYDDEKMEDLEYSIFVEKKTSKNRKTHKYRLKELKKNKDFN